jgi:hypothetical protein
MTPRSLLGWAATGALCALSFLACGDDTDDVANPQSNNQAGTTGASGTTGTSGTTGASGTEGGSGTAGSGGSGGSVEEAVGGEITGAVTWTKNKTYILSSLTFVRSGATLTIEPGTVIKGKRTQTGAALIVEKGGKLIARGTKDAPIVFTSGEATRTAGDFGGVMLNGNAKVNLPGGSGSPEGIENGPTYGGNDDAESSGELSYVRIEFAGFLLSKDNELNALTLNAIGSGTKLDHVQVHFGTDDGFEWFGGTVSGKYLLATGIEDDCFDWDFGWRGKVQFLACVQDDFVKGDNGIEADNNASTTGAEPFSNPMVSNITLVGKSVAGAVGRGMLLRRGTKGMIYNAIITGFPGAGLDIDGSQTVSNAKDGSLGIFNSLFANAKNFAEGDDEDKGTEGQEGFKKGDKLDERAWALEAAFGNKEVAAADLKLASIAVDAVDVRLGAGSVALSGAKIPEDPFFDKVSFIGACGETCDEFAGWTSFPTK